MEVTAVVVEAVDPHLESFGGETPQVLDRFYREARAAARLDHPGLCWVLDVGQIGTVPYFVMRYIAGCPLSKSPALSPRGAAAVSSPPGCDRWAAP